MKHTNGNKAGSDIVTTVSLTRDEAEKLINSLFKHKDIKPVFVSDYDEFQRGFDFLMQELRNWKKQLTSEKNDILFKTHGTNLYPLPFQCTDIQINGSDTKVNIKGKLYESYIYNSTVKYMFEGTTKTRMGKIHNVHIQYIPCLKVHFIPTDIIHSENMPNIVQNLVYKCLYFNNSYKLRVTVDDNILYTRDGDIDENFQAEIDDKIKKYIENTTLDILEGTMSAISLE